MFDNIAETIQSLIVIAGIGALIYSVFKNSTVRTTISSQKELIETLTIQVNELRTLHEQNEKSIAELRGQVSLYKELPLANLAQNMKKMQQTQKDILIMLDKQKKGK